MLTSHGCPVRSRTVTIGLFFRVTSFLTRKLAAVGCAGLARLPPHGFLVPVGVCSFHRASAADIEVIIGLH